MFNEIPANASDSQVAAVGTVNPGIGVNLINLTGADDLLTGGSEPE